MLLVQDLKKSFQSPDASAPSTIVDVPTLTLAAGEQIALLGSSGSGKTTLLHLLAGILSADTGTIQYKLPNAQPVNIAKLDEPGRDHFRGQHIGYIFQSHHLLAGLTAMENVLLGMSFTGRHADRAWAAHLLERVGLSHRTNYKPGKLSVGQQQRVAVARAMANRPVMVLADEPTGSLDSVSAQQTLDLIRSMCDEVKSTLLLVTHDLSIAGQLPRQLQLSEINRAATAPPIKGGK